MIILHLILWLFVLIAVIYISFFLVYSYLCSRAFRFLRVDLLEFLKMRDDHQRQRELLVVRLSQQTGLAIWNIYNGLKVFSNDEDKNAQSFLERLKNLSADALSVDGQYVRDGKSVILPMKAALYILPPKTQREKEAIKKIKAAIEELEKLRSASKVLMIDDLFTINIKIRFLKTRTL